MQNNNVIVKQQQQPQHKNQAENIHQVQNNLNNEIAKVQSLKTQKLLKLIIGLCVISLILTTFSFLSLVIITALIGSIAMFLSCRISRLKRQGLINKVSPKGRKFLLEKSIFDIYSDLIYFPLVTKVIGAFLRPAISKPHPNELKQSFEELPQSIQQAISKKGILSLAPQKVQDLVLSENNRSKDMPERFGKPEWEWYNYEMYENHHQKPHEQTISRRLLERLDQKVSWPGFAVLTGLVACGIFSMKSSKIKKMLIQNGSFAGFILVTIVALAKLKKIKQRKELQRKAQVMGLATIVKDE